jgi:hypothetical protein
MGKKMKGVNEAIIFVYPHPVKPFSSDRECRGASKYLP